MKYSAIHFSTPKIRLTCSFTAIYNQQTGLVGKHVKFFGEADRILCEFQDHEPVDSGANYLKINMIHHVN